MLCIILHQSDMTTVWQVSQQLLCMFCNFHQTEALLLDWQFKLSFSFLKKNENSQLNLTKLSNFFARLGTMFTEAGRRRGRRSRSGGEPIKRPTSTTEARPLDRHALKKLRRAAASESHRGSAARRLRRSPPPPLTASAHVCPSVRKLHRHAV